MTSKALASKNNTGPLLVKLPFDLWAEKSRALYNEAMAESLGSLHWELSEADFLEMPSLFPKGSLFVGAFNDPLLTDFLGFAWAGQTQETLSLQLLATRPGIQRKGVGRALLGFCKDHAKRQGALRLECIVKEESRGALRFYRSMGALIDFSDPELDAYGQKAFRVSWRLARLAPTQTPPKRGLGKP